MDGPSSQPALPVPVRRRTVALKPQRVSPVAALSVELRSVRVAVRMRWSLYTAHTRPPASVTRSPKMFLPTLASKAGPSTLLTLPREPVPATNESSLVTGSTDTIRGY